MNMMMSLIRLNFGVCDFDDRVVRLVDGVKWNSPIPSVSSLTRHLLLRKQTVTTIDDCSYSCDVKMIQTSFLPLRNSVKMDRFLITTNWNM